MSSMTQPAPQHISRPAPVMSVPRRIPAAFSLAWRTLRTGRHPEADAFLTAARLGMERGISIACASDAERTAMYAASRRAGAR